MEVSQDPPEGGRAPTTSRSTRRIRKWETLNSMVPIWQRRKCQREAGGVQQVLSGQVPRLRTTPKRSSHVSAEGAVTYKALLYHPRRQPPMTTTPRSMRRGCSSTPTASSSWTSAPTCCRSTSASSGAWWTLPDLSLNISRELLQHDRQLKVIAANLEKKIKSELGKLLKDDREELREILEELSAGRSNTASSANTAPTRTCCRICCCSTPPRKRSPSPWRSMSPG